MIEEVKLKPKEITNKQMYDIKYKFNLSYEEYIRLTNWCDCCELINPKVIQIHHIDRDKNNNNITNLIGICSNCHFLVHKGDIEINNIKDTTFINIKTEIKNYI